MAEGLLLQPTVEIDPDADLGRCGGSTSNLGA
jgi:hypothetical protein